MRWSLILVFAALATAAGVAVWEELGLAAVRDVTLDTGWMFLFILPVVVMGFLIAELVRVLIPEERVTRLLGRESGLRGLSIATIAGLLTPGGPFASFPLVLALYRSGADIGTTVAYITAWAVLGINRVIVWEIPLLGWHFVALRILVSLPTPFVAGWVARALLRLFPARGDAVRDETA